MQTPFNDVSDLLRSRASISADYSSASEEVYIDIRQIQEIINL